MHHGFFGKLLRIDLSRRKVSVVAFDPADARKFFLGSGLAAKILYEETPRLDDPFKAGNPLIFLSGLFTGGPLPGTSKLTVCSLSPQTGIWNEATVGGHWPAEFRRTGVDGMILVGRAKSPVMLRVTAAGVEFLPADDLWGLDTYETGRAIEKRTGGAGKIACIGQAGERRLPIAGIIFDPPITRVAARAGIGAVMGAKNLKAIVVEGDRSVKLPIADPKGLSAQVKEDTESIRKFTVGLTAFGTSGGVEAVEMYGDLPIKNWRLGAWKEGAKKVCGQAAQPRLLDRHYSCHACPIRCGKIYRSDALGIHGHGPEYETIGMLGSLCMNDDPDLLAQGNEWCNRYGMDSISAGACCAFAIEAFERGIITTRDTGGLALGWDGASMLALVHKMGRGEDIGLLIGQGVKRAAAKLGRGAAEFAVETKGLEYPAHDPRGHVGMALNYVTAARGACHLEGLTYFLDRGIPCEDLGYVTPPDPHRSDDKPPIVVAMQDYLSVFNPLGMCKFLFLGRIGPKRVARWLELFCGWDATMGEVMATGERIFNIKRLYNERLGMSRKDDVLPPRLYAEAKPDGAAAGVLPDLGNMLFHYYKLRGWDGHGLPTAGKIATLGLTRHP